MAQYDVDLRDYWRIIRKRKASILCMVLLAGLCIYGFAKFRARFRRPLFILVISTILIPYPVIMIPQFVMFQRFGWMDTYLPLIGWA